MKIKNLVIMLCMAFLQAPMISSCMGADNKSAEKIPAGIVEDALIQKGNPATKTEANFYDFVREIETSSPSKYPNQLKCNAYENSNMAFAFMLTLFDDDDERKVDFGRKKRYKSDCLELEYAEENANGGFARLKLTFKNRGEKPTYTIIFTK